MNLALAFNESETVVDGVPHILREALATPEFWKGYRNSSFADLQRHGVSLHKEQRGWIVRILHPKTGAVAKKPLYTLKQAQGLRLYQREHVGSLVAVMGRYGAAIDGSDTGTGKTYCAAALTRELGLKLAVVAPKSILRKWFNVCRDLHVPFLFAAGWEESKTKDFPYTQAYYKFEPMFSTDGKPKINPKTFKPMMKRSVIRMDWKMPRDTLLVIDEAHRAKGTTTANGRLLLGAKGIPTLMLSATIAESPRDLWAAGQRLQFHQGGDSFRAFCERFWCFKDGYKGWSMIDRDATSRMLHDFLYPEYGSRISIRELGDLFPKNNVTAELIDIENPEKQNKMYYALLKRVDELKSQGKTAEALLERLRYRQAAELSKVPALSEMAQDAMEEGNSVAIFVNFTETRLALAEALHGAGQVHGGQPDDERMEVIRDFQSNRTRIVICNIKAGGISIDLHDLKGRPRLSLISPSDSAVEMRQALGRIHRDGALSPAQQRIVFAAGTVEEEVYANAKGKMTAIDTINDGDLVRRDEEAAFHGGAA